MFERNIVNRHDNTNAVTANAPALPTPRDATPPPHIARGETYCAVVTVLVKLLEWRAMAVMRLRRAAELEEALARR